MPDTPLDFLGDLQRTHMCGELRAANAGQRATLMGWVNKRRDLGNLIFVDVRDRTGVTQAVFDRQQNDALHEKAAGLRSEFVVAVTGQVKRREAATVNPNLPTGEIELEAAELRLLNTSEVPPFSPSDGALANEEVRLKYRYLDMRRPAMQNNLELRHKIAQAIRADLSARGFLEIETPFMTRSTPEGARDYLVPSRIYPGSFYALPQSPQLFKQILMIAGCDKYFQIVRCFRDEDLRADRQPEFTQIDLEMSFPTQDRVFAVVEGFLAAAFAAAGVKISVPFPRMTYDEAMSRYGSDKPDLRLPPLSGVRAAFGPDALQALALDPSLPIMAVRVPKVGELSRKEREDNRTLFSKSPAVKLIDDLKRLEKSWPEIAAAIREKCQSQPDDFVVLVGGAPLAGDGSAAAMGTAANAVFSAAGGLRLELARKYADRHQLFAGDRSSGDSYRFLWVTDFPMFEWNEEGKRWEAAHHPFTSPHEADMQKVLAAETAQSQQSDLGTVRCSAYDVVLNGMELGSGSIRIHRQDVQQAIFRAMGIGDEEARARFGFFLEALTYGTPPHGGIALGLDRIVMILAGADSLREVIPFPKTAKAVDLMVDAPTPVNEQQLRDLGISVKKS
jgi:aspartyl-tRNA synthetase